MRIRVEWETDGANVELPEIVEVPAQIYEDGFTQDGAVSDWLSDTYGWLVADWTLA